MLKRIVSLLKLIMFIRENVYIILDFSLNSLTLSFKPEIRPSESQLFPTQGALLSLSKTINFPIGIRLKKVSLISERWR